MVSQPQADNTYRIGEAIDIDITFTAPVDVNNASTAASLWFGETNGGEGSVYRGALYQSGSGTDTIRLSYTVQPDDHDDNGLHVGAKTATGFGGGRIKAAGTDVDASHSFAGVNTEQKVDGQVFTTSEAVTSSPLTYKTYRAGATFLFEMVFNYAIDVEGDVHLSMRVGPDDPDLGWRAASYKSGSGKDTLVFGYTIKTSDKDSDGITVLGSWTGDDGSTLGVAGSGSMTIAGTDYTVTPAFSGVANANNHRADGSPYPISLSVIPRGYEGEYLAGDVISSKAVFDQPVDTEESTALNINFGEGENVEYVRKAPLASGSGTDTLIFNYTVQSNDSDDDGITLYMSREMTIKAKDTTVEWDQATPLGVAIVWNVDSAKVDGSRMSQGPPKDSDTNDPSNPPSVREIEVLPDGKTVKLTFNETVGPPELLRTVSRMFTIDIGTLYGAVIDVTIDGRSDPPTYGQIAGLTLTLETTRLITLGAEVKVSYDNIFAADSLGMFVDHDGNPLQLFSEQAAVNNSTNLEDFEWEGPELVLSKTDITITEGDSTPFTLALTKDPEGEVEITRDTTIPTLDRLQDSPNSLTFTVENWEEPQTVTLTTTAAADTINFWGALPSHSGCPLSLKTANMGYPR